MEKSELIYLNDKLTNYLKKVINNRKKLDPELNLSEEAYNCISYYFYENAIRIFGKNALQLDEIETISSIGTLNIATIFGLNLNVLFEFGDDHTVVISGACQDTNKEQLVDSFIITANNQKVTNNCICNNMTSNIGYFINLEDCEYALTKGSTPKQIDVYLKAKPLGSMHHKNAYYEFERVLPKEPNDSRLKKLFRMFISDSIISVPIPELADDFDQNVIDSVFYSLKEKAEPKKTKGKELKKAD